jgi:hypothetical protein
VSGQLHGPAALPQQKIPLDTHWIGDWLSSGARLDFMEERNTFYPCRELNPLLLSRPARSLVSILIELQIFIIFSFISFFATATTNNVFIPMTQKVHSYESVSSLAASKTGSFF